jgi:hypothetical protein
MADRRLYQDGGSFHPGEARINLEFTAGTSGAVPSTLTRRAGIASVVLSGTGLYTVTFQDTWFSALGFDYEILQATYTNTHGGMITVTPTGFTTSSCALQVRSTDGNGTAVALTSGDVLKATFRMARQQGNG